MNLQIAGVDYIETPQDTATYRQEDNIPSYTVWPAEVKQVLEENLQLDCVDFDQGAVGYGRPWKKPKSWLRMEAAQWGG